MVQRAGRCSRRRRGAVATACQALLDEAQDDRDEAARWDAIMAYQHAALDRSEH
jgi:ERCC4-related helicase